MSQRVRACSLFALAVLYLILPASALGKQAGRRERRPPRSRAVLWRAPANISSRDLFHGPGSAGRAPAAPFTFVEEDRGGESPKFDVRDSRGARWRVKLGPEAQAETTATRLVWAVGYFAEEAYYFDEVRVRKLPRLSRGRQFVGPGGLVRGARFEPQRRNVVRGEEWSWDDNPFRGTRELSGLKVLMILLNNYDARKGNNRVLRPRGGREAHYYVTDLGATLGKAGGMGGKRSKNNLKDFLSTRFVTGVEEDGTVEFDYDTRPTRLGMFTVFYPPYYLGEVKKEKAMRGIPLEHARWVGSLLSQLTDDQLRAAFRAAKYDDETAEGYVRALRERIGQLANL